MSYFSSTRGERDIKPVNGAAKIEPARPLARATDDVSTLGSGMQVTGNIVCSGSLQIFGRVTGDIHASHLAIREGARVEGKVIAPEAVIEGAFTGTIHSNAVKLQKTAQVEGEIFNKSLAIEENARFEGVSRRLERAIEGPSAATAEKTSGAGPAFTAAPPLTTVAQ